MPKFLNSKIFVSDGAVGTELLKRSNKVFPEILNLTNPNLVESLHSDYISAGADIITTNSFGIVSTKTRGYKINIYDLSKASAQLAKNVAQTNRLIFGSIGPSGLRPQEEKLKSLANLYSEQISGLIDGGVDLILIETMIYVEEMSLVSEITKNLTNLPIALSMSFRKTKRGFETYSEIEIKTAIKEMLNCKPEIIGANCGNGFAEMVEIAKIFRAISKEIPILIKASAGTPQKTNNQLLYPDTPEKIPEFVEKLINLEVNIIGGCCGTTPEHIKVIRNVVDRFQKT